MKEIGQLLLETGFLMAMPESPQQKQWRLGAHFREQHFSVHRPGLCEPLRQSSRNQHTRRASLCFPQTFSSTPKVPDSRILFKGFNQALSQDEMAPPGVNWENLSFPGPLGPGTKREELHLLPSPPTLGRTHCAATRQLLEQRLKHSLGKSHPNPVPTDLSKIHLALF